MKNVLITGASGFIGGFLAEEGLKRGYQVYAGIRSSSDTQYIQNNNIQLFTTDLSDKSKLIKDFLHYKKMGITFQYIIHNAGITKAIDKEDFMKINYQYTRNLAEALMESHCIPKKFLYMSSLEAYGTGDTKTMEPVLESDIPQPFSFYGKSKLKSEQFITSLTNFPYIILRPTGVYGPRERDYFTYIKSINRGIEIYIGRDKQHLSFIYVKDLARVTFTALESKIVNSSYFVTDGKAYTNSDLANIVKAIMKKKCIKIILPKITVKWFFFINEKISSLFHHQTLLNSHKYKVLTSLNWLCNSRRLENDFAFHADYDLRKGMEETIDWYKKNSWI